MQCCACLLIYGKYSPFYDNMLVDKAWLALVDASHDTWVQLSRHASLP